VKAKRIALTVLILFVLTCVTLLVSGRRVLVWEVKVNPGEHYIVEEHGNLGASQQSSLVCRYFTGRSILTTVFWYSPNNVLGKDQCPFIGKES
jgi:hypothetical protein